MAEGARDDAVAAQTAAETNRDNAVTAAEPEVKVVGTTKNVGGTSITIDGVAKSSTVNKVTRYTGLVNTNEGRAITTPGKRDIHGRPIAFDTDEDGEITQD